MTPARGRFGRRRVGRFLVGAEPLAHALDTRGTRKKAAGVAADRRLS